MGYVGILTLILAGTALALRRERRTWAWAGLAGISFVLALGIYAIPHGWLTLLPGFGQLRAPARLVLLTDFALAALAAIGLDAALKPLEGPARAAFGKVWRLVAYAAAAVLAIGVPLAYAVLLLTQDRDGAVVLRVSITLIAVVTFAGLLLASLLWLSARRGNWARTSTLGWLAAGLILLDLASLGAYQDLGGRDPSLSFEQPAIAGYLAAQQDGPFRIDTRTQIESAWQPDTALLEGFEDVGGVANPLALADATRYWENLGSRSSRLYDLLNVRYVIAVKDVTLDWDKFALAFDGDPQLNVYENRRALPRAFVVGQVQPVVEPRGRLERHPCARLRPRDDRGRRRRLSLNLNLSLVRPRRGDGDRVRAEPADAQGQRGRACAVGGQPGVVSGVAGDGGRATARLAPADGLPVPGSGAGGGQSHSRAAVRAAAVAVGVGVGGLDSGRITGRLLGRRAASPAKVRLALAAI